VFEAQSLFQPSELENFGPPPSWGNIPFRDMEFTDFPEIQGKRLRLVISQPLAAKGVVGRIRAQTFFLLNATEAD